MSKHETNKPRYSQEGGMMEHSKLKKNQHRMPDGTIYTIKSDRYQKERLKLGGETKMLDISCADCQTKIMVYQKDGMGDLKRCYLDRIGWLHEGVGIGEDTHSQVDSLEKTMLCCPNCKVNIGSPMIYDKENRSAIRMFYGKFAKSKYQPPEPNQ